ncbi:MAG: hypothetical protein ACI8RD_002418 [Bacillariaceae sp.]|jgi:hypothetical protein
MKLQGITEEFEVILLLYLIHTSHNLIKILTLKMKSVVAILLGLLAVAHAIELTPDNYDDAVAGKTVFIKFQAPW